MAFWQTKEVIQPDNNLAALKLRVAALETALEEVQTKVLQSLKRYNQRLATLDNQNKPAAVPSNPHSSQPQGLYYDPFSMYDYGSLLGNTPSELQQQNSSQRRQDPDES